MTIEQLRNTHQAIPFQPFTIHLADGRDIAVARSEYLSMSPSGRTCIVQQPNDRFQIIDLLLVTSLKVQGSPTSNGQV